MKPVILFLAALAAALIFIAIWLLLFSDKEIIRDRLRRLKATVFTPDDEDEEQQSFYERVIDPTYVKFIEFLSRMTPKSILEAYQALIYHAGESKVRKPTQILAQQIIYAVIFYVLLGPVISLLTGKIDLLLGLFGLAIGFILPYLSLRSRARKRQEKIQAALPDMIDLLYISVEAGLGFYMALTRVTARKTDVLSMEIKWMLDDIAKGRERTEAMKDAVRRVGVDDFNIFITAVIQSEALGTNISNILKIQSQMMRLSKRQRSEAAAMKLPVKLIFPIIFFLFPVIFIIVLGPAVLNIITSIGESGLF